MISGGILCLMAFGMVCVLVSFLWTVLLPLFLTGSLSKLKAQYNKSGNAWAVVTGTTSGIGLAFVKTLFGLGFNVMMISRNRAEMERTVKEMADSSGKNKIEFICIDLSGPVDGLKKNAELVNFINTKNITILVNNAGLSNDFPKMLSDYAENEAENILTVNCMSVVVLTRMILPKMIAQSNGCIVNLSSLFGSLGGPLVSVYSGTKNFIDAFSLSLNEELKGTGVRCVCSIPGFVISKMSKLRKRSLTVITPEECAETVLKQVAGGVLYYMYPHWTHAAIGWFMLTLVPQCMRFSVLGKMNRATNKAALKKMEKK